MENVATYSEARSEYTKQLAVFIVGPIVLWFQDLWARNSMNKQNCLVNFQTKCEEVPKWNQDRIHDEVRVLLERSGCDYMEDLVTGVFIAHAKVLTAVRITARPQKMNLTIPKLDHFIHHVYRECARAFWKSPYLFMTTPGDVVGRQRNIIQIEALATEAITTAVRSLLPVKDILRDCFEGNEEVVEEEGPTPAPIDLAPAPPVAAETPVAAAPPVAAETPVAAEAPVAAETPVAAAPVAAAPVAAETPVAESPEIKSILKVKSPPATVSIQTEPAVHFSDFVSEFDETKEGPQIRYNPKLSAEDLPDKEDPDDEEEDEKLLIDESSAQPLSFNDIEDLEPTAMAPTAMAPTANPPEEITLE